MAAAVPQTMLMQMQAMQGCGGGQSGQRNSNDLNLNISGLAERQCAGQAGRAGGPEQRDEPEHERPLQAQ